MKLENEIHQKEFRSEYNKALLNMMYTHSFLISKMNEAFHPHKVTRQQYNVLRILRGQHPQSISLGIIRDRMLDKMPDASRMVERLRIKGFVYRKISKEDRRSVDINITSKGLKFLDSIEPTVSTFDQFMSSLSLDEVKKLNALLDKLRA